MHHVLMILSVRSWPKVASYLDLTSACYWEIASAVATFAGHAFVRALSVCFYHLEMALIDGQTSSMRSSCFLIKIIETDDLLVVNQLTTSQ